MKSFFSILAGLVLLLVAVTGCSSGGSGGGGPRNEAPTANAGVDQSVDGGTTVDLSATGADTDGTIVGFSWQQESGTAVTIANANMASVSFAAPRVSVSEVLVFRVTVTDNDGATGSDTVSVTVIPSLLADIGFDGDVPGAPPATGGLDEPTSMTIPSGASVLVQAAGNGISTQPVVLDDGGTRNFVNLVYAFSPPAPSDILRVEATVSFNRLFAGYFLQTTVSSGSAVVNRLIASTSGELQAESLSASGDPRPVLGTYLPNEPFRLRMDIDIEGGTWSFILDDERNGFDDDPVITGLPFVNNIASLPYVGAVSASLNVFPASPAGATSVAYDDIRIVVIPRAAMSISINPGNDPDAINPDSRDVIPVAILGSGSFDATQVDSSTARFGPGRASLVHGGHVEDINNDDFLDMLFHFNIQDSGLACGDTEATLSGETFGGDSFAVTDSFRTAGCR